jgi:hypothetical protein
MGVGFFVCWRVGSEWWSIISELSPVWRQGRYDTELGIEMLLDMFELCEYCE